MVDAHDIAEVAAIELVRRDQAPGKLPDWQAYETRLMTERYVSDGMIPAEGDVERLTTMLGRPLHS